MYFVYILRSLNTGRIYKGLTDNLDTRLEQHSKGTVKSTKNILPLELVHVELCSSRIEARKYEKFFKSGYGREIVQEIVDNMRMW